LGTDIIARTAAAWARQPAATARVTAIDDVDQWTIQINARSLRPLWKYTWPDGQQVYVSQRSGEVVQYTTAASRVRAYLGPIPHWLYFARLRKHPALWSAFVIWSSGFATIAAILGLVVGVWVYSPARQYRIGGEMTAIPYRGLKRWHVIIGLIVGVAAATWAF